MGTIPSRFKREFHGKGPARVQGACLWGCTPVGVHGCGGGEWASLFLCLPLPLTVSMGMGVPSSVLLGFPVCKIIIRNPASGYLRETSDGR